MQDIIVHPPEIVRHLFKRYTWKLVPENADEKVIYITIDDGPIPEMTPGTLDMLAQYNAKATFFCVGDNVRKYPDLFKRIKAEGHSVGNHTFNHLNGLRTKVSDYLANVEMADPLIDSDLFRPPHGKMKHRQTVALSQGRKIVLWDVLSKDYDTRVTPERCWENVSDYVSSGSIILFHDNLKATPRQRYALQKTLERYSEEGYTFKAIPYKPFKKADK
ncbi:MAG: polysaccharide deacetylase family protein [Bacteroidales bacterium]|nr:polysaccharide deacetylase family protein [Bacteroidales bacterium]